MNKILIIDDNISLLNSMELFLEANDYNVITSSDGYEAIEIAKNNQVDIIICDINMPVINGLKVLEKLRQDPVTLSIPFIFLTAEEKKDTFRQGMELGADDYLNKPVEPSILLRAIKSRLKKHEMFKEKLEVKVKEFRENITLMLPHELKTPLTGILGFSDFLLDSYDETMPKDEVLEIIRYINVSAIRLESLIENFLLYSNLKLIQTNDEELKNLKDNSFEKIKKCVLEIAEKIANKYERPNDLLFSVENAKIKIKDSFFQKMITELIDNAFKFSIPGKKVEIEGKVENGFYILKIIDLGKGILPEQINKIEAFMQFNRRTQEQQGAGLGLIISKLISEVFGFDISIKSKIALRTEINILFKI